MAASIHEQATIDTWIVLAVMPSGEAVDLAAATARGTSDLCIVAPTSPCTAALEP